MKKVTIFSIFAVATLIVGVSLASFALAQSGGRGEGKPRMGHFGRGQGHGPRGDNFSRFALRGLDLTDAQKEQLKQINQNFRERTKSLRDELHAKHQELRGLNSGESFNETLATQKLAEVSALQAKMMGEEFKLRQEIKSILTEEQKTQLEQMKVKRAERKPRKAEQGEVKN